METIQTTPQWTSIQPISHRDKVSVIIKGIVRTAEAWSLSNAEAAALLDVPSATWGRMKAGSYKGKLHQDKVTRASLIVGIFEGLRLLFHGPLAYGWPKTPNTGPGFNGKSPIQIMCEGGIPAMIKVRQHIDTLKGGV